MGVAMDGVMEQSVTSRNVAIYPVQEAMLIQFAKENGLSVSAALRFILNDWLRMKREARSADEQPEVSQALTHCNGAVVERYKQE